MATVTSCTYEFRAGSALAFGLPTDKHFQIGFNYWANGEMHTGEFSSAKALPAGTLFPISYDPEAPHQHTHSDGPAARRPLLVAIGILGTFLLALLWFFLLRNRN